MSQELQTPEPPVRPSRPQPAARPLAQVRHRKSSSELIHEAEDDGFAKRHRGLLIVAGLLVLGLVIYFFPKPGPRAPVRKAEKIVTVQLPPPLPPKVVPPPPQKVPPPEKLEKPVAAEDKPKDVPKKADNPPPSALATGIKGDGPGMGLGDRGNGLGGGNSIGGNGSGGGGSKFGWYAGQIQSKVTQAMQQNPKTQKASLARLEVRIWPDGTGRVTRAELTSPTGDAALDTAIRDQVLTGLQLPEAPPAGMKLPIVLRLAARRP